MAATLGQLETQFATPQFLANDPTGGLGNNPIQTGVPTGGGTTTQTTTQTTSGGGLGGITSCSTFSLWNPFCWGQIGSQAAACVGDALLRIGLFILGLMAIAGAIYLYRGGGGTSILAVPGKLVGGAVKGTGAAFKNVAGDAE